MAEKIHPVYAVFGSEDFLRRRAVETLIKRVLGDDAESMGLAEFDGNEAKLADVLDECRTPSLMAPIRLVLVRDADDFVSDHREALEKYLQSPSSTGVLVLVCKSWAATTRLYKLVAKVGENIDCKAPKGQELAGWVMQHARETYGCSLDLTTARRLVELIGAQLGLIDMELAKLATYVAPGKAIKIEHVEELVGASRMEKVFAITDAIAKNDAPAALALWDQVIASDRDAPFKAIGGLAFGFRKLAEAKRLLAKGLPIFQAAKIVSPFAPPEVIKRQLDRFTLSQWRSHLVKLLSIDLGGKTGLGQVRSAVEKLVVELCSTGSVASASGR